MERLLYLDLLKGIAIFFVVIGHVMIFSFGIHHSCVQSMLVLFHMPIFFYVSGFLAYRELSGQEVKKYILRKLKRLLFPWISVSLAMHLFSGMDIYTTFIKYYWFFYVLIILSLIFICFEYLVVRHVKNIYLCFIAYVAIPTILLLIKVLFKCDNTYFPFSQTIMYFFPFMLGWSSRKYSHLNEFLLNNSIIYICSLLIFLYSWYYSDDINILVRVAGGIGAIIVLQAFLYKNVNTMCDIKKWNLGRCISMCGKGSCAIYMLNTFFIPDLKTIMGGYMILPNGFLYELFVTTIIAIPVIIACLFVESLFKNNKYLSQII